MPVWSAEREWPNETVYIIASGPSISSQNIELLRGRRVIVINSSYTVAPWADILFFADGRWWDDNKKEVNVNFNGRIVTTAKNMPSSLFYLEKVIPPPGLSSSRCKLVVQRTSLQASINLAVHLGTNKIVILGADMGRDSEGRTHHHKPHKWSQKPGCWDQQMDQLQLTVEPLKKLKIDVINCSEVSRIKWWPKMKLEDTL